ncbi:MAG TPA: hypothetical protein VFD05_03505 [Bacilli bacterium]|nr:hypothetical protein [Bacilli bacterium]
MNKEYLKGVLDAKLSALLTENDYNVFASFDEQKQIDFFLNLNLVQTKLVNDFEALAKIARKELSMEIEKYVTKNNLIYLYFFGEVERKKDVYKTARHRNELYQKISATGYPSLADFVNKNHYIRNLVMIYRSKSQNIAKEHVEKSLLAQNIVSSEQMASLCGTTKETIVQYVNSELSLNLANDVSSVQFEEELENYLRKQIKDYAFSPDVEATLIYYINEKLYEIYTLRKIYYTKGLKLDA